MKPCAWKQTSALLLFIMLMLVGGCAKQPPLLADPNNQMKYQGYSAYGHYGESSADVQYIRFRSANGIEQFQLMLPRELPRLVVAYEAQIKAGKLTLRILDPNGKAIIGGTTDQNGHLKLYHSLRTPAGVYTVQTIYENAEHGDIHYKIYGYYR